MENLPHQASQLWTMLDDMANNNPAAYRKFIDKQLKEGKEALSPPKPYFAIETIFKNTKQTLYINVFGFHRIKKPPTDDDPVSMICGEPYEIKSSENTAKAISIAMHPEVLDRFGPEATHDDATKENKDALVSLCIDFCEDQLKEKLARGCRVISKEGKYKGDISAALKSLRWSGPTKLDSDILDQIHGATNSGDIPSMNTSDLVNKINNFVEGKDSVSLSDNGSCSLPESLSELKLPGCPASDNSKKSLIQEINDSANHSSSESDATSARCCYRTDARYTLDHTPDDNLVLSITLHDVDSVSQCQLDISSTEILLTIEDDPSQKLSLKWPHRVLEDKAKAQFKKKLSRLLVTVPVDK